MRATSYPRRVSAVKYRNFRVAILVMDGAISGSFEIVEGRVGGSCATRR